MDISEILEKIGGFGRSQMRIIYPLNAVHIYCGLLIMLYVYIGEDPGWTCPQQPDGQDTSSAVDACARVSDGSCTPQFSKEFTSIVTEWSLICSRSSWSKLTQSAFFFGCLLGSWLWGKLADKIGRRKVFFLCLTCTLLSGVACSLAYDYYSFVLFRVGVAFSSIGTIMSSYVLSVEVVGVASRSYAGVIGSLLFGLGLPLLALMAYFIRQWRLLTLLVAVAGASLFALWRVIPESPRWLLVNGRREEAMQVLADIARGNGTVVPKGEPKDTTSAATPSADLGTTSLFAGNVIRRRSLIVCAVWFTECMVYYGLSMRVSDLGNNRYISLSLSGLVELPAVLVAYKLLNRIGRRWTQSMLLLISGVACLLWTFSHLTGYDSVGAPIALLGKFAVAGAFAVSYLYTTELFPTEVRNVALGVASAAARVGGILAPIVLMAAQLHSSIPMLVMGSLSFVTGMLSFCLPETLNLPLPETLRELELA